MVMTEAHRGRVVLVTGASRGIGRAAAKALGAAGAHVILLARTVGALEEVDDEIRATGGAATLVPLDLKDFPALDRLGATIFERWGRLDALLGNAGVLGALTPLAHLDPKTFAECLTARAKPSGKQPQPRSRAPSSAESARPASAAPTNRPPMRP